MHGSFIQKLLKKKHFHFLILKQVFQYSENKIETLECDVGIFQIQSNSSIEFSRSLIKRNYDGQSYLRNLLENQTFDLFESSEPFRRSKPQTTVSLQPPKRKYSIEKKTKP